MAQTLGVVGLTDTQSNFRVWSGREMTSCASCPSLDLPTITSSLLPPPAACHLALLSSMLSDGKRDVIPRTPSLSAGCENKDIPLLLTSPAGQSGGCGQSALTPQRHFCSRCRLSFCLFLLNKHIFSHGRRGALNPADVLSQPSGAEAFGCLEELEEVLK